MDLNKFIEQNKDLNLEITPFKVISTEEYLNSKVFEIPETRFIYSPTKPCSFSPQGEQMVMSLLGIAPSFAWKFDQVISPDEQQKIAQGIFDECKSDYANQKSNLKNVMQNIVEETSSKKYYETNRSFGRLVPISYHRTTAPRISTYGSTFHGMKKELLLKIIKYITKLRSIVIIDIDMGAAHTRMARYLLHKEGSNLDYSLKDPQFWQTQINNLKPNFEKLNVNISDKTIKKLLKVGLYTSLNGGNPYSTERLVTSLTLNAENYFDQENIKSIEDLKSSNLYLATEQTLKTFQLVNEVKMLNTKCAIPFELKYASVPEDKRSYLTYTVDKCGPYKIDKPHKGISRVLQGFEVTLLTVLVKNIIKLGGIPLSLDHDGVLVMFSLKNYEELGGDPFKICKLIESGDFSSWSKYLLEEEIPLEPKRLVLKNEIIEY